MHMFNNDNLKEMEACLKHNKKSLIRLLREPQDNDICLSLSGILRLLLTNNDMPVLIKYAKKLNVPLFIANAHSSPIDDVVNPSGLIFAAKFPKSGWDTTCTGENISIEEYLDIPLGITPVKIDNILQGEAYTPRTIIKWYANKCGVAHLNLKKSKALKSALNFKAVLNNCIYNLADWALVSINYVLIFSGQDEVLDKNIDYLKDAKNIEISTINRFAHYIPLQQHILSTYIIGEHQIESSSGFDIDISHGFSWHVLIKIIEQREIGKKVIYALGNKNNNSIFNIVLNDNYSLEFNLKISSDKIISVCLPPEYKSMLKEKFCSISCFINRGENNIELSVFINGSEVILKNINCKCACLVVDKQVIGANLDGKRRSAFFITEFILAEALNNNMALSISKYLWNNIIPPAQ